MSRITIIAILYLFTPVLHAFEYYGPYSNYLVTTIGDFYTVCESLENPDSTDKGQAVKAHTCLAYISGIMVGYTSTISLGAEYELANKTGKKRSEIARKIDSDETLHEELSQIADKNHFICNAFSVNLNELTIDVTQRLKRKNLNPKFLATLLCAKRDYRPRQLWGSAMMISHSSVPPNKRMQPNSQTAARFGCR